MKIKILGGILIVLAVLIFVGVTYKNSVVHQIPVVFSSKELLNSVWVQYKKLYLEPGTNRTLDKDRGNITTSEGESYTMLRSVWLDDKDTFDKSWQWTKDILQRKNDHLLSWLFGLRSDNTYGIIVEQNGQNTASDADTDIALSLIFASYRWNQDTYKYDALPLMNDIWKNEVVTINGNPYLASNDVEKTSKKDTVILNPSYFAPYAYRIFAKIDPSHPWNRLVDTSYDVLKQSVALPLDKTVSADLPPNWVAINKKTGKITASNISTLTSDYGYDALRVPWRIELDWLWNHDPRANDLLKQFSFLDTEWKNDQALYLTSHDGKLLSSLELPSMYGGSIGYFMSQDPAAAEDLYNKKLKFLYNPDIQSWKEVLSYYDDNWAWFGIALYSGALSNLSTTTP